jgi:hypothetical protein
VSQRSPAQRSAAQSVGDAWPAATVGWAHRTVRCAPAVSGAPTDPEDQRSDAPKLEGNRAPDCPVHHPTEGKFGLPSWPPMAPSCLGAIKGTPRPMEELPQAFTKYFKASRLCSRAFALLC